MKNKSRLLKTVALSIVIGMFLQMSAFAGTWKSNSTGWWFDRGDGSYPANQWEWIDGNEDGLAECYYFNQQGYMAANTNIDGSDVNENGQWTVNGIVQSKSVSTSANGQNANTEGSAYNGHHYEVIDVSATWEEAEAYCEKKGGHLASITSEDEQKFIASLVNNGGKIMYWLGGYKEDNEWCWINGDAWSYTNWAKNQPDNYWNGEDKLMLYNVSRPDNESCNKKWNDINETGTISSDLYNQYFTKNYGMVCEWDY